MKNLLKFLLILVCSSVAQTTFGASPELRQDSIKSMLVGDKLRTVFYVYAPESRTYKLKFWVMGTRVPGNAISTYEVGIDGTTEGYIQPSRADWCMCAPYSMSDPYLTEGTHEIYLQAFYADVPNAEAVLSYSSTFSNVTDSCNYENMKNHYEPLIYVYPTLISDEFSDYRQFNYNPSNGDTLTPPMGYTAELNKKVFYTFYRLEYYMAGETVSVNVNTQDNLQMVIHVLSQDGTSFSATSLPTLTTGGGLSCYIPYSGFYYVLVRSYNPDEWGTCNVSIQNGLYGRSFENVPVNCSRTDIESPNYIMDYSCFAKSSNGDPIIFLMNSGNGGGIVRYNDDFSSAQSNFDWKKNARIDGNLTTNQWIFTLTKSYPSSTLKMCDIYTRCEKVWFPDSDFPYYEIDDFLISSYSSNTYNCLSWAVGEWLTGYWLDKTIGNAYADSILTAYNYILTTESKSTVDLWATHFSEDSLEYEHFSVKSKTHPYAGGYAWESKLGSYYRVFHPRYDLRGEIYGDVIKHYKVNPFTFIPDPPGPMLLNINLTGDEYGQIEAGLYEVLQRDVSSFNELYQACQKEGAVKVSLFIDTYEKVKAYKLLLEYCKNNRTFDYLLYQKVCERDILAIKLLKDLTLSGSKDYLWNEAVTNVQRLCSEQKDEKCLYNAQSYGMYLIKLLLAEARSEPMKNENVTFSNSPLLKVRSNGSQLTISFELDTDAIVSVYAGNTEGTVINTVANKQRLEKGEYTFNYMAPKPGSYVVGLVVNGAVYKKTIFIH